MEIPAFDQIASSWDITALEPAPLRAFYGYWQEKRGQRELPLRADIDPLDIPKLLPMLLLLDIERLEPMHFRFRLVGTYFRQFFGRDFTGIGIEESRLPGGMAAICRDWREVLQRRQPRWATMRQEIGREGMDRLRFTGIALPLSRDGAAADMLMVATFYHKGETG